jgi:hypothetical protein
VKLVGPKTALRWYLRAVGVMDRKTARVRAGARTLHDVGELTARWLDGELPSQPGYAPDHGPANETRDLVPSLVAANRAGFITHGSQPGCDGPGYDGAWWQQHAAVEGFTDDAGLARLQQAVEGTGLRLTFGRAHPRRTDYSQVLDGMFGAVLSASDIRSMYDECDPDIVEALVSSWQVCVQDPEFGDRPQLWSALDLFSGRTTAGQASVEVAPLADEVDPVAAAEPPLSWYEANRSPASVDAQTDLERLWDAIADLTYDAWRVADRLQGEGIGGTSAAAAVACAEALVAALEATSVAMDRAKVEVA